MGAVSGGQNVDAVKSNQELIFNLLAKLKWSCRSDNLSLVNFVFLFKCFLVFPIEKGLESVKGRRNMLQMCKEQSFFIAIYNVQYLCA